MAAVLRNWQLYALIAPVLAYYVVFHYMPMYGLQIAFKDFMASKGIGGSEWVGLKYFKQFFDSFYAGRILKNTLGLSALQLLVGFPMPILLALMISELREGRFKRTVQSVTYAPHFLSAVVLVGMMMTLLSPGNGLVGRLLALFGAEPIHFFGSPGWFKPLYALSDVWQNMGWASIIYLAALAGIDPQLYEAAVMDGAGKLRKMLHITLPGLVPTIVVLLILNLGTLMSVGFEKAFLMQNDLNLDSSEVVSTYVYKKGLIGAQISFGAAVGLFNSVINFTLLVLVNGLSRRCSETSLW
ncbi:ABC transporter permease subunit [Paenibacillus sacheonensis]|uniref:ABC transporter permease subunit n=2 Tax=Paenibacillus sacheonensis TaxID=742054 RepID=A0A7X4YUY0_9BACL|nr:ABC transporter permease subunit [Paenibacillus sacheonensis]